MKDLDKRIFLELLKDAEQPVVDIAEKVGASRQTVSKKVKEFKQNGFIEDTKARLNPEKFGLDIQAFVLIQEDTENEVRKSNEEKINNFSYVSKFFRLFGRFSGILEVWAENRDELTDLVKEIHEVGGVSKTETFIVHSKVKDKPGEPLKGILEES